MTDRSDDLARYLVLETARQSAGLMRYFIAKAAEAQSVAEPSPLPAPGCWPVLTADEVSLGFAMAANVIRGAGFPDEAYRLSSLIEVQGHG